MTASSGQPAHGQARPESAGNTVNDALTPKRRNPVTENPEYAAFARRILRAYGRRVATGDVESLSHLIDLADDVNEAIQQAVNGRRILLDRDRHTTRRHPPSCATTIGASADI